METIKTENNSIFLNLFEVRFDTETDKNFEVLKNCIDSVVYDNTYLTLEINDMDNVGAYFIFDQYNTFNYRFDKITFSSFKENGDIIGQICFYDCLVFQLEPVKFFKDAYKYYKNNLKFKVKLSFKNREIFYN